MTNCLQRRIHLLDPTVKHTGQESGGELCKFTSDLILMFVCWRHHQHTARIAVSTKFTS